MCPPQAVLQLASRFGFLHRLPGGLRGDAGEITPHDHPMTLGVGFRYQSQEFARIGACQCEGEPLIRVTPARV